MNGAVDLEDASDSVPLVNDANEDETSGGHPCPAARPQHDWTAFSDDEGQIYYYNSVTEETSWDPPADGRFNPPEEAADVEDPSKAPQALASPEHPPAVKSESIESSVAPAAEDKSSENTDATATTPWSAHYDDDGRLYYYHSVTEESAWDPPEEGFIPPDAKENVKLETSDHAVAAPESRLAQVDDVHAVAVQDALQEAAAGEKDDHPSVAMPETSADTEVVDTVTTTSWSTHYDDDGRIYYYNSITEESAWDPPEEGFLPPEEDAALAAKTSEEEAADTPWIAYQDEEGRDYYYNEETGETQWDPPASYRPGEASEDGPPEASVTPEEMLPPADADHEMDQDVVPPSTESLVVEPPDLDVEQEEAPVDPAVLRLRDAEAALEQPDSVLEPGCMLHVSEVVAADGGNPTRAISALIEHYQGQTAVCGLLARWQLELRTKKDDARASSSSKHADAIRNVIQDVIYKVAKERFTKEAGDKILDLSKSEAAFLEDMMDSPRWRKLLIDLTASHKDSAVLLYCLRAISKRGHHREIAQRINQSDHFAVFNAMLVSELTVMGRLAVNASSDLPSATQFARLIQDLIKACSSTSYTYLYSMQLLRRLQHLAKSDFLRTNTHMGNESIPNNGYHNHGPLQIRFRRVIRKWEALSQTLESSMMTDPLSSNDSAVTGSSHLLRKRQLEVALMISELHQRQQREKRRKLRNNRLDSENGNASAKDSLQQERLELGLTTLLKRHFLGMPIDDSILDKLLPVGLDINNTGGVGELLIQYPVAVRALLSRLYRPGPTRITSPSTKNKCARLIALAMFAAEKSVIQNDLSNSKLSNGGVMDSDERTLSDELEATKNIVQGSIYCEQLETMISFFVTADSTDTSTSTTAHRTVGEKLSTLALTVTPVGLGVAIWAREFTQGKEYAASATYPTLSPSILSLIRLVAMKHPFARADALQVGLSFLRHSNADISYQKVNSIKECGLRLLIFLLIRGDVVPVVSSLLSRVQQVGSSELDASLIRYFVAGVLEVVQPPFSPLFVQVFGTFLTAPKVMDAVRSAYFSESNRKRLKDFLASIATSDHDHDRPTNNGDKTNAMVSLLLSTYR
jgi:TH1 protein/WW domain